MAQTRVCEVCVNKAYTDQCDKNLSRAKVFKNELNNCALARSSDSGKVQQLEKDKQLLQATIKKQNAQLTEFGRKWPARRWVGIGLMAISLVLGLSELQVNGVTQQFLLSSAFALGGLVLVW